MEASSLTTGNVWILHTIFGELNQAQNEQEMLWGSISVAVGHDRTNMSFYDWVKSELFVSIRDLKIKILTKTATTTFNAWSIHKEVLFHGPEFVLSVT